MSYRNFLDECLKLSKALDIDFSEAEKNIRDMWIAEKRYNDLYLFLNDNYRRKFTNFALPFLEALLKDNELIIYRNYWRSCLREQIKGFWYHYKFYNENHHNKKQQGLFKFLKKQEKVIDKRRITTEEFLAIDKKLVEDNSEKYPSKRKSKLNLIGDWYKTLEFIDKFIEAMEIINDIIEIEKATILKESIYTLQKPKAKKTTDNRKIDESLFWKLIKVSQNESEDSSEFLEQLQSKLEAFGITEIKKFQKYFLKKMNELNHWDIWAMAFIVKRGCGDDAFDYFCAWVISRGEEAFESVRDVQIDKLKNIFSEEDPEFEDMMYVAQEAYENKKGEMMSEVRVKVQKIQGEKWEEATVCESYPKLCELFGA